MIRINLLPKKVSRKKIGLMQHLVLTGAALLLLLVGMGYYWMSLNARVTGLKRQVAAAEAEKQKLKDVNSQKAAYEQNIAKLKGKLDIIGQIKEARFMPVRLFDQLTLVLNRNTPVWLTSYSYSGDKIVMEGYSLSNPDLAAFVTKMEKTPFYRNVELLFSEKTVIDEREVYRFSLNALTQTEDAPVQQEN
jgi:type IV pilus assembly protein PilN